MSFQKMVKCEQKRSNCKSYHQEYCTCLTNTNFGKRQSPFFRTSLIKDREVKKREA